MGVSGWMVHFPGSHRFTITLTRVNKELFGCTFNYASVLPRLSDESWNRVATFYIRLRLGYECKAYPYRHTGERT